MNTPGRPKKSFTDFEQEIEDAWDDNTNDVAVVARAFTRSASVSMPTSPKRSASTTHLMPATTTTTTTTSTNGSSSLNASTASYYRSQGNLASAPPENTPSKPSLTTATSHSSTVTSMPPPNIASSAAPPTPVALDYKSAKFQKIIEASTADLAELRTLSWKGLPAEIRPKAWQLLCGYLPANRDRRESTLKRKREEYRTLVDQYYPSHTLEQNKKTHHQIEVDIERTGQSLPLFRKSTVKEMFWRILYIWAIRHPGSGYVQGINDLAMPFFIVFLTPYLHEQELGTFDIDSLSNTDVAYIEADSFWCLSKLLDGIQDNFIFAQPGIQTKVKALRDLISRIDAPLHHHLAAHNIEYLQFALRWMNCLLMRELPLACILRLWDTYHAEEDGFAVFHQYVCASFLETFSKAILECQDFQSIMLLLQKLPTDQWGYRDIDLVVAEAFRLKFTFHGAQKHITDASQ